MFSDSVTKNLNIAKQKHSILYGIVYESSSYVALFQSISKGTSTALGRLFLTQKL